MKKFLKHEGNTYEGIFIQLPGKQNYGHLVVGGVLLYGLCKIDMTDIMGVGKTIEFSCGQGDEVVIVTEEFAIFTNLKPEMAMKEGEPQKATTIKPAKPIKLNKREEIQAMSKDAEEIMAAIRQYAVDDFVYLKDVQGVKPNKLYGHLTNLINAGYIKRVGKKDKKRGTKVKIMK